MLNIKRENLNKSKVKLIVNLPPEIMGRFFNKVYDNLSAKIEVKGFRPGKAPKNLTIMQIGENHLTSEIIDLALKETYPQALTQEKLLPIAPPKINIKKMVDLTGATAEIEYEAEIELLPEIKVGDYKNLKITHSRDEIKVSNDEIDQVISHLRRQQAQFKDIDAPAKEGDRVEMDFEGKDKGVLIEQLSSKNYPVILGSKVLIPAFEKEIIGLKKGETKEFKAKAGKDNREIDFKVNVHQVSEVLLPELNESFAKQFQKNTIDELKDAISKDIAKQKESAQKQKEETELLDKLLAISEVEAPQSLVDQEVIRTIDRIKEHTNMSGITFEKYLLSLKKNEEDFKKELTPQAEKNVKIGLVLGEVGKLEKINLETEGSGKEVIERLFKLNKK